jgi:hypothetical protein
LITKIWYISFAIIKPVISAYPRAGDETEVIEEIKFDETTENIMGVMVESHTPFFPKQLVRQNFCSY